MALGRFKAKRRGPGGGLNSKGKLKKGCRFLKGGRISCKTKPTKGGYKSASKSAGKKIHVSRERATKKNGRLKKGCRFTKSGAICLRSALRRRKG